MRLFYPKSHALLEDLENWQKAHISDLMRECERELDHDVHPEMIAETPGGDIKLEICSAYGQDEVFVDRTTRSPGPDVPVLTEEAMRKLINA